jgi:hypothetical protein
MVMVVADPILEPGWRSGGLNAPDEALDNQDAEGVVHRLERDGPDLAPDNLGHAIGRDVGLARYRPQDRQSLGRDLNAALTEKVCGIAGHAERLDQLLDRFKPDATPTDCWIAAAHPPFAG